jgi:hypothetical protein
MVMLPAAQLPLVHGEPSSNPISRPCYREVERRVRAWQAGRGKLAVL